MAKQKEKAKPRRAVSQSGWLTLPETAVYCGVSERWVEKRKADGTLPFYKLGAAIRFKKSDLDAYLAKARRVGR